MDKDSVEQRIEAARVEGQRAKDNAEFIASLKPGDSTVKYIHNPEAFALRSKFTGMAERGEMDVTGCTHPLAYIEQYIDDDPLMKRAGRPVNLFECGVCRTPVWFCDPWGRPLSDD
jgi:hypothetical protein